MTAELFQILLVQALKGKDITIFGDGSHTRSFQYVDDLIEGMIKMMESPGTVLQDL